mmetsp:Transcript_26373/g.43410  ORF Transcript_26373/g.43410 Transcript_26373/m.43410 type:complete len:322 (-) Transcript_26373:762-1727(-)
MPPPKQLASSLPKGGRANPRGSSTPLDRAPRLGQIRGDSRRNCSSNRQPSAGITGTFLENFQQRSGRQPHPSRSGCGSGYRSGGTWWPLSWRPPQVPWRPAVPLIAGSVGTSSLPPPPPPLPPLPRLCSPWRRKAAAAAATALSSSPAAARRGRSRAVETWPSSSRVSVSSTAGRTDSLRSLKLSMPDDTKFLQHFLTVSTVCGSTSSQTFCDGDWSASAGSSGGGKKASSLSFGCRTCFSALDWMACSSLVFRAVMVGPGEYSTGCSSGRFPNKAVFTRLGFWSDKVSFSQVLSSWLPRTLSTCSNSFINSFSSAFSCSV